MGEGKDLGLGRAAGMERKQGDPQTRRNLWRYLPLAALVGGLILALLMGWHRYLSFSALHEYHEDLGSLVAAYGWMAGVGYLLFYALVIAFSIPGGLILTVAGGFLFGSLLCTAYVLVGATLGATGIFIAARSAFGSLLRQKAGPFIKKMEAGFQANELSYMLILRLVPLFPFWLVNIVPAFLGVSLRNYVIGTFFGIIPGTFVFASVGSGIGHLLENYDPENPPQLGSLIFEPQYIIPIAGLILLASIPVIYRIFKKS